MNGSPAEDIEAWEGEGGAASGPLEPLSPPGAGALSLTGTANQVEWAQRIKRRVNDEFDRERRHSTRLPIDRRTASAPIRKPFSPSSKTSALK